MNIEIFNVVLHTIRSSMDSWEYLSKNITEGFDSYFQFGY